MRYIKSFSILVLLFFGSFAWSQVQLRYEGYIEDGGVPVNQNSQAFTVRIRKPGCATAAPGLSDYSTATINIVNGEFNLTPTFNEAQFAAAMDPLTDWGGGGSCGPGSAREMQIGWSGEVFNVALQDAPRAIVSTVAQSAQKLSSRTQDQFLKIDSFAAQTPLTNAQVNTLVQLVNGTATNYMRTSDTAAGDLSGTFAAPIVDGIQGVGLLATAPTLNQVLKFNGTAWAPAVDNAGTGTVTNVTSLNAFLTVTSPTTTPALTLNVGTGANTVAAGNDTRIVNAIQNNGSTTGAALIIGTNDNFNLNFETNGTNKLTILNTGNVGIGISSPTSTLHVAGTTRLGASSSTISKVIFCNPTINVNLDITGGSKENVASANNECTGVESGMVLSCSFVSENSTLSSRRYSWTVVAPDAADQSNNRLRVRITNGSGSDTIPIGGRLDLACMGFKP
jgi:hypothetical protein